MIDFSKFYQIIAQSQLSSWLEVLPAQLAAWQREKLHNRFYIWQNAVDNLPSLIPQNLDLVNTITADSEILNNRQRQGIEKLLRKLIPWRKGPYLLYGTFIDTEWRSDWKWNRVASHISSLMHRVVLDVGCGNGYYMWRMLGSGANLVVGIDPTRLFLYQFEAVRKLLGNDQRVHLLPLRIEQLPELMVFDTVFSMGVLYHCRSPFDHLFQLKKQLVSGGELVLETLIISGDEQSVLVPEKRYARMRNVWFIPSKALLQCWLKKCGFVDIRIVNISRTTKGEQHCTRWTTITSSLDDFLDPNDHRKTLEGYPAPLRAVLIARKI